MAQEIKPITEKELKDLVLKEIEKLNRIRIYYECKKLGSFLTASIKYVEICVALTNLGLPINVYVVSFISDRTINNVMHVLHLLGDKNILVFKRGKKRYFEWVVRPSFLEKVL